MDTLWDFAAFESAARDLPDTRQWSDFSAEERVPQMPPEGVTGLVAMPPLPPNPCAISELTAAGNALLVTFRWLPDEDDQYFVLALPVHDANNVSREGAMGFLYECLDLELDFHGEWKSSTARLTTTLSAVVPTPPLEPGA